MAKGECYTAVLSNGGTMTLVGDASARGAFTTEPMFVLPNASYHVEKRVSDTGAEVWWLRRSKGTTFIFR